MIFVIVNLLTKMVHYKPVKVLINAPNLAKVIIDIVIKHHGLLNSIVSDWRPVFNFKFRSSLYYFLDIKRWLSISFYPQTNSQREQKTALWRFICELTSTWNKTTRQDSYPWPNSLIITQKTLIQAIHLSSLTAGFTLEILMKKMLIPVTN